VVTYIATASDNAPGVTLVCSPASGTAFSLGQTTVTCTATDGSGNTASKSFNVTVNDTESPVLTVPANMTKNATSPSGAVVTFVVTATDNAPGVTKACVPPSGSTFAIGTTTVNCTATDGAGNTDSKSFQITVLGAVQQLQNLKALVQGMNIEPGFKNGLLSRLDSALKFLNGNNKGKACQELAKFLDSVNSKSGKKILGANATTLTNDANRIRSVLGC
jgi:HYR domain